MADAEIAAEKIRFVIEPGDGFRRATFHGVVNDRHLIAAYRNLIESAEFDPGLNDLVDLRAVEHLDISPGGIRRLIDMLSELDKLGFHTKVAIVAGSDAVFGISRMYAFMRSADPSASENIHVFRDHDQAVRWLQPGKDDGN